MSPPFGEPRGIPRPEKRPTPRFISSGGRIHMEHFSSLSYDEMIRQMVEPLFPYRAARYMSKTSARLQVEELPDEAVVSIIDRIGRKVEELPHRTNGDQGERLLQSQTALSFLLMSYVRSDSARLPRGAIEKIRSFRVKDSRVENLEKQNIGKLMVLDERNKASGQSIGLGEQVHDELFGLLATSEDTEGGWDIERRLIAYTLASGKGATKEIMYQYLDSNLEMPPFFYKVFANALDFDTLRTNLREYMDMHPESKEKLDAQSKSLGLDSGETVMNLADFYRNEPLDAHGPYSELQAKDLSILEEEFRGRKRVIDVGCGKGRLMLPLRKEGVPVEGVDVVAEYGDYLRSQDPQAVLHVGSMNNLPFKDGEVDGIFIMGRTSGHWKNMQDGIKTLAEFHRVLAPTGSVVLDLPDITSGEYMQDARRRAKGLEAADIWNYEFGDIHSSPNNIHYFDRLMPGANEVKAMALLAGFTAEIIDKVPFSVGEGKEATNLYWKLAPREGGAISGKTHPMDIKHDELITLLGGLSPADLEEFGIHVTDSGNPTVRSIMLSLEDY